MRAFQAMNPRRLTGPPSPLSTLGGTAQINRRREPVPTKIPGPTARQWLLHTILLLLTVVTTTICGIVMAGPDLTPVASPPPALRGLVGSILLLPWIYLMTVLEIVKYSLLHPHFLVQGLVFSGS